MNRFQLHVMDWKNCTRCEYSERRKHVVLGKGDLPCDILFVAEAPGDSEDVCGVPMIAQAGRTMDRILIKTGIVKPNKQGFIWGEGKTPRADWKYTVSFTNLVGCIPLNDLRNKEPEPDPTCVLACKPRLQEWIEFADPKMIVVVGKPAAEWFDQTWSKCVKTSVPIIDIVHPAYILRSTFIQRNDIVQQQVVRLRIGIRDHILKEKPTSNEEVSNAGTKEKVNSNKHIFKGTGPSNGTATSGQSRSRKGERKFIEDLPPTKESERKYDPYDDNLDDIPF